MKSHTVLTAWSGHEQMEQQNKGDNAVTLQYEAIKWHMYTTVTDMLNVYLTKNIHILE